MTHRDFYNRVESNLDEGYKVRLIAPNGFKMEISFAFMDNTGEPYFSCAGIEDSRFAHNSEIMNKRELERFVVNTGFEIYK